MLKKLVLFLAVLVIFASFACAADIKTYSSSFNMVDANAVVETDVIFYNQTTKTLEFSLPQDYQALSVYIDNEPAKADVRGNLLRISIDQNTKVSFNYVSSEFIDKGNFLMNMKLNYDADNVLVTLTLPEGATLKKPIKEGDLTSGSIYPKPDDAKTDGRSLIFYWLRTNVKKGDEIAIFAQVLYAAKITWLPIAILIVLLIIIASVLAYVWKKKPKTRIVVEKEDLVEKHLKEDEEQIVNVLKLKGGQCEQGTLRIATGFSKATLSRLLSELEERKVISKEKRGKKNLVFLKK